MRGARGVRFRAQSLYGAKSRGLAVEMAGDDIEPLP